MALNNDTLDRLSDTLTIEITTTGRRTGRPSRIEIWWWRFEDRFIITGTPGPRDWYANLVADGRLTIHALGLDLSGVAELIPNHEFRRRFFESRSTSWYSSNAQLERLVDEAPMVEILFQS